MDDDEKDELMRRISDEVRVAVRLGLAAAGLVRAQPDDEVAGPGLKVIFSCSCGREVPRGAMGCGELHVIPIKIDGVKSVDLKTIGAGGCVLSPGDRAHLVDILSDPEWFGDYANLR